MRDISYGGTAFVYEEITIEGGATESLYKYSGDATPVVINTINPSGGKYQLLEASVGTSNTGVYYVTGNPSEGGNTINIYYPQMNLKGYIGDSFDSFAGETINKSANMRFVIESQYVGAIGLANVTIFFTTPVAGKTSVFGDFDFMNHRLDSVQKAFPQVSARNGTASGSYVAQAEFVNNGDISFIGISDTYKKSNTISFTVQSAGISINVTPNPVVRSNPFMVTIQGESLSLYFVSIENADEADVNPILLSGQTGMQGDPLTFADQNLVPVNMFGPSYGTPYFTFPGSASSLDNTSGYFMTDENGSRTIEYSTSADTTNKTYTIRVNAMWNSATVLPSDNYDDISRKLVEVTVEDDTVILTPTETPTTTPTTIPTSTSIPSDTGLDDGKILLMKAILERYAGQTLAATDVRIILREFETLGAVSGTSGLSDAEIQSIADSVNAKGISNLTPDDVVRIANEVEVVVIQPTVTSTVVRTTAAAPTSTNTTVQTPSTTITDPATPVETEAAVPLGGVLAGLIAGGLLGRRAR